MSANLYILSHVGYYGIKKALCFINLLYTLLFINTTSNKTIHCSLLPDPLTKVVHPAPL